jgi:predicted RND superfamily exporter protein
VEKTEARTYLCGPFWSSFVDAYVMDENDIVEFTYDETASKFEVVVFNADREEKPWVQLPGMFLCFLIIIVILFSHISHCSFCFMFLFVQIVGRFWSAAELLLRKPFSQIC